MSIGNHLISRNIPGYGPSDGSCLPCSGVTARAVSTSIPACYSRSEYKTSSPFKILSLKCVFGSKSSVCNASSGSYRRNPEFSRHNKHGFSRGRNRQNEDRDSSDNLEESDFFPSKNGPLLSVSGNPKFQATVAPGPREKEIVELFRKVQAQLRERAAIKEEKKNEDLQVQGQSKQNETVDSLLKLLRKHSVQQGKRSKSSDGSRDFILDQPEQNGSLSTEESSTFFGSDNTVKNKVQRELQSVSRPVSKFRRRSPVPQLKNQPTYPDEETVNSISHTIFDGSEKETGPELEAKHEFKQELKVETELEEELEPLFPNGGVLDEISEDEASEPDEGGDSDEEEEQNMIENRNLSGMKLPELRALAKTRGMKGFSKLKKHELVEWLTGGRGSI